jgi:hypothetical protein
MGLKLSMFFGGRKRKQYIDMYGVMVIIKMIYNLLQHKHIQCHHEIRQKNVIGVAGATNYPKE